MEQEELYKLIGKILTGQANESEIKQIEEWQQSDIQNRATFQRIRKVWKSTRFQGKQNTDVPFQKVLNKINNSAERSNQSQRPSFIKYFYRAAAVILIILSFAIYRYNFHPSEISDTPLLSVVHKINPPGQKSKVYLPDGSIVWLNAESELQFPQDFDSLTRTVQLSGEAYFEIAKDPKRPFTVETGNLRTTAIGTSFNIKAFQDQNHIWITLAYGKIKVASNEKDILYLEPGDGIEYDKDGLQMNILPCDVAAITAWKDGVLLFKEADFNTIIQELERWYGVTIHVVGNPHPDIFYTGRFINEYLSNVLESMSFGRPFTYDIEDKNVTIKF